MTLREIRLLYSWVLLAAICLLISISSLSHLFPFFFDIWADIDECIENTDACDKSTTTCRNSVGSYSCTCRPGYERYNRYQCNGKLLFYLFIYSFICLFMPPPNLNCSLQRILPPSSVVWLLATEDQKKKGGNNCGKLDNKTNDQKEEDNKDKYRSRRHTIFAAGYPTNF